jgi:hypothetical protein
MSFSVIGTKQEKEVQKMKKLNTLMGVLLLSILLLTANVSFAGPIVWDNGPGNTGSAEYINNDGQAADDFWVLAGTVIADAHFWTMENDSASAGYAGVIAWTIYEDGLNDDSLAGPGDVFATGFGVNIQKDATGIVDAGFGTQYLYSFDLDTAVVIPDGSWYWFGLNLPGSEGGNIKWDESDSSPGAGENWYWNGDGDWRAYDAGLAFNLTTTAVPEPSTMLLLVSGLVGLGFVRRRFKA